MAVIGIVVVSDAVQTDHDRVQEAVGSSIQQRGAPPDGLMAHVAYPADTGFTIVEAWRTEELFRAYVDELLLPAVAECGLTASTPEIRDAWSIARP